RAQEGETTLSRYEHGPEGAHVLWHRRRARRLMQTESGASFQGLLSDLLERQLVGHGPRIATVMMPELALLDLADALCLRGISEADGLLPKGVVRRLHRAEERERATVQLDGDLGGIHARSLARSGVGLEPLDLAVLVVSGPRLGHAGHATPA